MNIFKHIDNDFNYVLSMAGDDILINDSTQAKKAIINNLPVNSQSDLRTISSTSELDRGDYITWDSGKWLIISEIGHKRFNYYKGIIQKCNYNIKFIIDGIVKEFPAIVDSKYFDVETGQYISVPTGKVIVTMQLNEKSQEIGLDKRFIKMCNAFKVVGKDLTKNGLLILHCDLDTIDTTHDDVENEVANGKDYVYSLSVSNGDTANISPNDTLQLTVVLQLNGTTVTDKEIGYSSNDSSIATVDQTGLVTGIDEGECIITAYMVDMPDVKDTIAITVEEVVQDNFTYELLGANDIVKGQSQSYQVKKYNNGVFVDNPQFTFEVIPGSTPTSAYTLSVVDNDECSITANSATYNITLKATDTNNSMFVEKLIKLKNLF